MGYNSTLMILNDCLNDIKEDAEFGRKVHDAICSLRPHHGGVNIRSGSCGNAAKAIETHHSTHTVYVAVGGNRGEVVSPEPGYNTDEEVELLKMLAEKHGYELKRS